MAKSGIDYHDHAQHIRYCFVGDAFSGKSTLLQRIIYDNFDGSKPPTIGCSFESQLIECDSKLYKLDFWDTAGQEKYTDLVPIYYRNADFILFCLDLSNENIIESFGKWMQRMKRYMLGQTIVLVGTKCDIKTVNMELIREIQNTYFFHYCETSAKENIGIHELVNWTMSYFIEHKMNKNDTNIITLNEPSTSRYWCQIL